MANTVLLTIAFVVSIAVARAQDRQQPMGVAKAVFSMRVANEGPNSDWRLRLSCNGDTLFSGPLSAGGMTIDLEKHKSYHATFYINELPYVRDYYINGTLHDTSVIRFTCNRDIVTTSDRVLERYSEVLTQFTSRVWPTIVKAPSFMKAYSNLDSLLTKLENGLLDEYHGPALQLYLRDSVIRPVRTFLHSLNDRYEALQQHDRVDQESIIQPIISLSNIPIPTETYMMLRGIAYATAYKVPTWLQSDKDSSRKMLTVDIAKRVLDFVGEPCACEVGYGLYYRTSITPGVDFTTCQDSLPTYLLQLAETDSTYFCSRLKSDVLALCNAVSTKTIPSFTGMGIDSVSATRSLNMDSLYMLHFWGTWCKPCVDGFDVVQNTADTLESLGCRTIHIACENQDRFPIWKTFVEQRNGEHLFTAKNQANQKMLADQLAVSSFPTIMIIGRGGEILVRDIEIGDVTAFLRSIRK